MVVLFLFLAAAAVTVAGFLAAGFFAGFVAVFAFGGSRIVSLRAAEVIESSKENCENSEPTGEDNSSFSTRILGASCFLVFTFVLGLAVPGAFVPLGAAAAGLAATRAFLSVPLIVAAATSLAAGLTAVGAGFFGAMLSFAAAFSPDAMANFVSNDGGRGGRSVASLSLIGLGACRVGSAFGDAAVFGRLLDLTLASSWLCGLSGVR